MRRSPDVIELRAGDLAADWVPAAGMVGASLRHAGEELLGQRGGLAAYRERGSTFGIPLLHPWANRLGRWSFDVLGRPVRLEGARGARADEHGLPIHGLLAAAEGWSVLDAGEDRLRAAFDFSEPELLDAFPFEHRVELDVRLDPSALTVTTTVLAGGDVPVPLAFGFHPYLRIPGLERGRWDVRLPVRRRLVLDGRGLPTGAVEDVEPYAGPIGDRTWDDGFDRLVPGEPFVVAGAGRRIELDFGEGFPFAQVFAPPGQELVCFEPMAAPTNALVTGEGLRTVAPGQRATARFSVRVSAEPPAAR
jgi:galactose mutarotase-like enzyme